VLWTDLRILIFDTGRVWWRLLPMIMGVYLVGWLGSELTLRVAVIAGDINPWLALVLFEILVAITMTGAATWPKTLGDGGYSAAQRGRPVRGLSAQRWRGGLHRLSVDSRGLEQLRSEPVEDRPSTSSGRKERSFQRLTAP
jgi:hypothetical protein